MKKFSRISPPNSCCSCDDFVGENSETLMIFTSLTEMRIGCVDAKMTMLFLALLRGVQAWQVVMKSQGKVKLILIEFEVQVLGRQVKTLDSLSRFK